MSIDKYDGTSSLGLALADLYEFSPKNQTKIAQKIKQGREALGIDTNEKGKSRRQLTSEEKKAIFEWHVHDYYVGDETTEECQEYGNALVTNPDGSGYLDSGFGSVEFVSKTELSDDLIIDQDKPNYPLDKFKRIAFYTRENNERVRKVIALELYYLNPLTSAAIINGFETVPEWLEYITDGWEEKKITTSLTRFVKHAIYQNYK